MVNDEVENVRSLVWLFLIVMLRPALVVATVWFPNASGLGVAVAVAEAVPFNVTVVRFDAVASVELTTRLPVTVPMFAAVGEKVTVTAHDPPAGTELEQPVASNGAAVANTTLFSGTI